MENNILPVLPGCEIISERIINAPLALVYKAWTDPGHLQNWWGPAGFTNTFTAFDLRPGGKWNFIMHGPEKGNFVNECEFVQIREPELIWWKRISQPVFQVIVTFEALNDDRTQIIFRMVFDTAAGCDKIKGFAPEKNEENFDKLQNELAAMMLNNRQRL